MKKAIVVIIICMWTLTTFSQDNYPLIQENKTWNILAVTLVGPFPWNTSYSTLTYEFFGDTTIDSQTYLKLYESNKENPLNWNLWGYMREENKKVWLKFVPESPEILMYDFNAMAGDTLLVGLQGQYNVPLVVDSIGLIEINGTDRIKYHLSFYDYTETWIDGIGSSSGMCYSGTSTITGGWYELLCMSENEELMYQNPDYESCYLVTKVNEIDNPKFQIYPNPTKDQLTIRNIYNEKIESITLSNANGQVIKHFNSKNTQFDISDISSGIYFLKIGFDKGESIQKVIIE